MIIHGLSGPNPLTSANDLLLKLYGSKPYVSGRELMGRKKVKHSPL